MRKPVGYFLGFSKTGGKPGAFLTLRADFFELGFPIEH